MSVNDYLFADIFEEVKIDFAEHADKNNTDIWLRPFNDDYGWNYEMAAVHLKPTDYAFVYYLGCECHSLWGCIRSLNAESPFGGITLFKPESVFKRTLYQNELIVQVEYTYCQIKRVFRVKQDSPLKFDNEETFQQLIDMFERDFIDSHNGYELNLPKLIRVKTDDNNNYIEYVSYKNTDTDNGEHIVLANFDDMNYIYDHIDEEKFKSTLIDAFKSFLDEKLHKFIIDNKVVVMGHESEKDISYILNNDKFSTEPDNDLLLTYFKQLFGLHMLNWNHEYKHEFLTCFHKIEQGINTLLRISLSAYLDATIDYQTEDRISHTV